MRVVIGILLVLAILAVVWEYYSPVKPQKELIATIVDVTDVSISNMEEESVENIELPDAPTGPVINSANVTQKPAEITQDAIVYRLITNKEISWIGRRVGGMQQGSVTISSGDIYIRDGNALIAGTLVLDMSTITAENNNATLSEQLQSAEYFDVESFPIATFEFIDYEGGKITGLLTLKGITKQITFPATFSIEDDIVIGESRFVLDRTEWNIRGGLPAVSEYMEISFELIRKPFVQ